MVYRISQLAASNLSISRSYVHLAARRVAFPLQTSVGCKISYDDQKGSRYTHFISRSYATRAVSRPKAHTGRTKASTPRKTASATSSAKKSTKKPAATKKPKAKPKPKATPKAKAKPKPKKRVKAKAKPKPKGRKVLTEKAKERLAKAKKSQEIKKLKELALTPPKPLVATVFQVLLQETASKSKSPIADTSREASSEYKSLSPERREHYNQIAIQNKQTNEAAYKKFIESHTPDQIRIANNARNLLKRRKVRGSTVRAQTLRLKDHRQPAQQTISRYLRFYLERNKTGEYAGLSVPERAKLASREYKALSEGEKQQYANAPAKGTAAS